MPPVKCIIFEAGKLAERTSAELLNAQSGALRVRLLGLYSLWLLCFKNIFKLCLTVSVRFSTFKRLRRFRKIYR